MAAVVVLACVLFAEDAHSQLSEPEIAEERARIAAERKQAEDRFTSQGEACRHVFQTTRCVDEANAERRRARAQLSQREASVNQIERRQRAADRLDRIRSKQEGTDGKDRAAEAEQRRMMDVDGAERKAARAEVAASAAKAASAAAAAAADRQQKAAQRCGPGLVRAGGRCVVSGRPAIDDEAFREKKAQAQAHREGVERRNAAKDPSKIGKPLPVPATLPPKPASSASRPAR